jgi:hypothetical protein
MQHSYSSAGLRNIASKWAQYHDPEALIAWMAGLPIQEDREVERADASRAAFRIWAADAPEEVEAWIEAASAGSMRDGALEEYARAIADASPGEALRWALQIEEADLRRKRALRYTRQWFVKDPVAARTWLAEANMSPERRQQILNNLPPQAKHRDAAKKAEPDG